MGLGIGVWGKAIERITSWLPFQGRVERYKNKLEKLKKERTTLTSGPATDKKAERLLKVDGEIAKYNELLKNKASD